MSAAKKYDVIILGAGAAGLMCAIEAGRRGRRVLVLDKAKKVAQKIRISGGGKSNFTNLYVTPENFLSSNPHFCKSALARFTQWDFISMMSEAGLTWEERQHGQLFCEQGAQAIIDMLVQHSVDVGVAFINEYAVESIHKNDVFSVSGKKGDFSADSLVIATGGPSIPRMGSTDYGVQIARQFGLKSIPFRPALVPFTFHSDFLNKQLKSLSGISFDASVSCNDAVFREQLLITHRGLSGPVILQISSYWNKGDAIVVDLLPDLDASEWLLLQQQQRPKAELKTVLSEKLVKRFALMLCDAELGSLPLNQYSEKELNHIAHRLNAWSIEPAGTEGMRTAEVATGGVHTDELSSKTMQANKVKGLYFIGETVDVTGHLGGFNFQWAWASGWCSGQFV